jgi:integrase
MKLGRATVANLALPTGKSEAIIFDSDIGGFGIRIREGGSRSWIFQFDNAAGKTRRITIGKVSAIDANKARAIASELHARVRLGEDPAAIKAESQARAAETFGAVLPTYLAWHRTRVRPATLRHTERHLVYNLKALHSLPINQVDRRAIAAQLQRMASSPVQANRTRSSLSAFLNWCLREGLVESNAALATNKNIERPRERVLSNTELRALWNALPGDGDDYGDILRLLILTGAREREISDLQWPEINFERGIIELPAYRVKNRRKHTIPMSGTVRTILGRREQDGRGFVFGRSETRGFSGWSKCKERLDEVLKIPAWTVHDLRRSAATGMAEIGIAPWIIESILNHVSGLKAGIAGVYNKSSHEGEKAIALQRWAEHVAAIVEGRKTKVMPLRGVS